MDVEWSRKFSGGFFSPATEMRANTEALFPTSLLPSLGSETLQSATSDSIPPSMLTLLNLACFELHDFSESAHLWTITYSNNVEVYVYKGVAALTQICYNSWRQMISFWLTPLHTLDSALDSIQGTCDLRISKRENAEVGT